MENSKTEKKIKTEEKKSWTVVENPPLRVSGTVAGSLLAAFMVQPRSGVTGGWSEINTFFAD